MSNPHPTPYGAYGPPLPPDRGPRTGLLVALVCATVLIVGGTATAVVVATGNEDAPASAEPGLEPESTPSPEPEPELTESTPTPAPKTVSTRDLKPCDLLSAREARRLGFDRGEKDFLDPRACVWEFADPGNAVRVWIQDDIGLAVVPRDASRSIRLRGHDAIQRIGATVGPVNSCEVAIGVTGTSRVDVVVNTTAGKTKACRLALRTARLVEPRLP